MKLIAPTYYPAFRCIAGDCRHSCCIGWEIDIDEETAAYYRTIDGELGQRLRAHIATDGDVAYFQTDEHDRCPFLNGDGLCDIILACGEDALCQICSDHPRFRRDLDGRTEIGLGLCCEAAASLILRQQDPFALITLSDDGDDDNDDDRRFLDIRDRFLAVATDRSRSLADREDAILAAASRAPRQLTASQYVAVLRPLERLDPAWDRTLDTLTDNVPSSEHDAAFEQILCYFLYRHIAPDNVDSAAAFAVQSTRLLKRLFSATDGSLDALAECCRQYSAEIEYSSDNLDILFDTF